MVKNLSLASFFQFGINFNREMCKPLYYEAAQPVICAVTSLYILPRENLCNYSHFALIITLQFLRPLLNAVPLVTAGNTQVIPFSAL